MSLYSTPAAPARTARAATDGSVALVSTSTRGPAARSGSISVAPSTPGSRRSSSTMSGRSEAASDTAVGPSPASPATTMPSCTSSSARSPRRTTG